MKKKSVLKTVEFFNNFPMLQVVRPKSVKGIYWKIPRSSLLSSYLVPPPPIPPRASWDRQVLPATQREEIRGENTSCKTHRP
jgi:hypothetical protein